MKPIDQLSDEEWMQLVHEALSCPCAPPQVVRAALELWREHGFDAVATPAGATLRRWVALLGYDSWAASPLASGVRALPSEARRLLYHAGSRDVDLRITPLAEGYALSGQQLGPAAEGGVELVEVAADPARACRRQVPIGLSGEFAIDGVDRGTYLLTLRVGTDEIVLPPIEIGPPGQQRGA